MSIESESTLMGRLTELAWSAVRTFVLAGLAVLTFGILLAGLSYYALREFPTAAAAAAALAAAETLLFGLPFTVQRAGMGTLANAIRSQQMGRSAVKLVFGRLLGVSAGADAAAPQGAMARAVERLPIARAEEYLTQTMRALLERPGRGGWLGRRLQSALLRRLDIFSRAGLHDAAKADGTVDLVRVQATLEDCADDWLINRLKIGLMRTTLLLVVALPALVLAQTYVLLQMAQR